MEKNCIICFENIADDNKLKCKKKIICDHYLHDPCYNELIKNNYISCPVCKTNYKVPTVKYFVDIIVLFIKFICFLIAVFILLYFLYSLMFYSYGEPPNISE